MTAKPIERCDICGRPLKGRRDRVCKAGFMAEEYEVNERGECIPLGSDCDGNEIKVTMRDVLRLMRKAGK